MLNTAAAQRASDFDLTPKQRSLLELNAFLQNPRSIGIDSLKESLSNVVRYMLELQGLDTGQGHQILCDDQHDSISLNDSKPSAKKKRKQMDMDAELLKHLEQQMTHSFEKVYIKIEKKLDNVKANIDIELAKLDMQIEAMTENAENKDKLESRRARRKRLKKFRSRVKSYQDEISVAAEENDTAALIEVEQNLHNDHEAFNELGAFPPEHRAPPVFDILPRAPTVRPDPNIQLNPSLRWSRPKTPLSLRDMLRSGKSGSGKSDGKGKGESGSASGDIQPPEMDV